jgi:hypothetical protein
MKDMISILLLKGNPGISEELYAGKEIRNSALG